MLDCLNHYKGKDLRKKFKNVVDYENFIDLFLKMMNYLPERRITAGEAFSHPYFQKKQTTNENHKS